MDADTPTILNIELIYALPHEQNILMLQVTKGTSIEQAIQQSGILDKYPDIDLKQNKTGIFGKLTPLKTLLRDRDRIEIYRPLIADPKEVRKQRAAEGKKMKKGGGEA